MYQRHETRTRRTAAGRPRRCTHGSGQGTPRDPLAGDEADRAGAGLGRKRDLRRVQARPRPQRAADRGGPQRRNGGVRAAASRGRCPIRFRVPATPGVPGSRPLEDHGDGRNPRQQALRVPGAHGWRPKRPADEGLRGIPRGQHGRASRRGRHLRRANRARGKWTHESTAPEDDLVRRAERRQRHSALDPGGGPRTGRARAHRGEAPPSVLRR